jgi:Stage II sporulation protein E (SpoIIE)
MKNDVLASILGRYRVAAHDRTGRATPGYSSALADLTSSSPSDLVVLVAEAARPLGATEVSIYLADFERLVLQPVLLPSQGQYSVVPSEDVASSPAGQAFCTGGPVVQPTDGGARVWVPLVDRSDRIGVLELMVSPFDEACLAECVSLGLFAGLLIGSFSRVSDLVHVLRRRRPMALAASMQCDLLPPAIVRCGQALACGLLQPAYEMAGDAFDYALGPSYLDAAIFDGMGHGLHSAMLTTLAVGAYRHSRRAVAPLERAYAAVDETVRAEFGDDEFVTGVLARLYLNSGHLEWAKAGHPAPLLMRRGRVRGELGCAISLPFGLAGRCEQVAGEDLKPGDSVLFYTDGVTEARGRDDEPFGVDRLARAWQERSGPGLAPEESLRSLGKMMVDYSGGQMRDDATFLLLHWRGPQQRVS